MIPNANLPAQKPPIALRVCINCGMPENEWVGNYTRGVNKNGKMFCCAGCANDGQCSCRKD